MSGFDDAIGFLVDPFTTKCETCKDRGSFEQSHNRLIIKDEYVEIFSQLEWDDSLHEYYIERSKDLEDRGVIPTVIIKNVNYGRQPIIGPHTNDNLSYGRYELARGYIKKISITGCNVTLINECVENFTIGEYGRKDVPAIELMQSATLDCPEIQGNRLLQIPPEPLSGSTKHSRSAKYIIWTESSKMEDFLSEDIVVIKKSIEAINPAMAEHIDLHTLSNRAERALELLTTNESLDVSRLLNKQYSGYDMSYILGAIILDMPDEIADADNDIRYEIARWPYLAKRYDIPYDDNRDDMFDVTSEVIIRKKFEGKVFEELSAFEIEVVYELIPLYSHSFSGKTHKESAMEWWNKVMK